MEANRIEMDKIIIVLVPVLVALLPTIQGYYIYRTPYNSLMMQIEPPLAEPYTEDSDVYNAVPSVLLAAQDYRRDEDQAIAAAEPESAESFLDFPTGTPESEKEVPGEPLTPQDFKNAENLEILVPPQDEDSPDPILSAGLFEGDIAGVNLSDFSPFEKNAIRDLNKRWPGGIIPYVISNSFNLYERSVIAAAVLDFHAYTCVRFVPRTTQRDYVHLLKGTGCSSLVGHFGGGQHISLGPGCLYKGIVEHELMHACGFWHEQSRGDRDEYVSVLWNNIMPGTEHNFQKFSWRIMQSLGVGYDTGSLMHYGRYAFSKDYRSPTIVPRNPAANIGQRRGFSEIDLLKINRLYECQRGTVGPVIPTKPIPYECSNNNRLCQYWANSGECKKNPSWMNVNCAKSCRLCDSNCGNYNRNCEQWAKIGECTKNPDYMTIYCPQACHSCRGGTHPHRKQNKWRQDQQRPVLKMTHR
ncbi:zinc metalloproteinase nas-15-like isoform X2 [Periplaneta americana]|uniref:zinc metalloproteinase nas-15-like isoform X2 n=1 Tax=Periplaneta americana TaxID=6978 RepID=UPI0037E7431D